MNKVTRARPWLKGFVLRRRSGPPADPNRMDASVCSWASFDGGLFCGSILCVVVTRTYIVVAVQVETSSTRVESAWFWHLKLIYVMVWTVPHVRLDSKTM